MPTSTPTRYRILGLKTSNVKRIKLVEVLPTGNVVTVGGRNDQGKSSLLDSIEYALAGAGSVCDQPIRRGASEAEIVVDLGDIIVTKSFKSASAPSLKVHMKDGSPVRSPQAILDALCSKISFDPMEWLRMKADKQLEMLRQLTGLDFTELNQRKAKVYGERTNTNRELTQKRAKLVTMPVVVDPPDGEVSAFSLVEKLNALRKRNQVRDNVRAEVVRAKSERDTYKKYRDGIETEIAEIRELLKTKTDALESSTEVFAGLGRAVEKAESAAVSQVDEDETAINYEIAKVDENNQAARDHHARQTLIKEIDALSTSEASQTAAIEAVEAERAQLLKAAKFPLPGLSFEDSGVLLDGVPFSQAGMAKKIRASVAISLALNPKLRVILIRDGSLLDEDSMKLLAETAEQEDCQIWVEVVGSKDVSIVIEDGSVKEV